jgi:hypothetical protein
MGKNILFWEMMVMAFTHCGEAGMRKVGLTVKKKYRVFKTGYLQKRFVWYYSSSVKLQQWRTYHFFIAYLR